MKKITITLLFFIIKLTGDAQTSSFTDTVAAYFDELKRITQTHTRLWNLDLYGPILLVNPNTRVMYSNEQDTSGILKRTGKVYSGVLPKNINVSNTSVQWGGKHWAMIMLPLPKDGKSRVNLLTHELFHRAQKQLGFTPFNPDNSHLDKKEGRIYLRLELEAIKKAISAENSSETLIHLSNAFAFRTFRHSIYPGADSTENLLELNEGICEFTGLIMSGRNNAEIIDHITRRIDNFIASPSYIRSFAYEMIPIYGYLLSLTDNDWNKKITANTNLSNFFIKAFSITEIPQQTQILNSSADHYNYTLILKEETERDENRKQVVADYKKRFIDSVHLELPLIKMNMSFDYTKMIALEGYGMVYPTIRITDEWGILDVENGAMISYDWKKIHVSYPDTLAHSPITGNGWTLQLKENFQVDKEESTGNLYIKRKEH